jgi:two-component system sporulation sensor kinase A
MIDNIKSMFIAVDIVGNIHFINSWGMRKLGYSPGEINLKSLLEIINEDDKKKVQESLFRLAEKPQETLQWQDRKRCKNGDILGFRNEASLITTDSDAFILIHCFESSECVETEVELVSENTVCEPLLQESENRFRSLFEHHPDAIYLMDAAGNYLYVNRFFEEKSGYTAEEALKQSFVPLVSPEDYERSSFHFQKALEGEPQNYEVRAYSKNGTHYDVHLTNVPIFEGDKVIGVYGIAKDVTETKRNREKLEQLHHINQLILNSVGEGIYGIDIESNVIFWNSAAENITGYQQEEFESESEYLHNLIHHTNAEGKQISTKDCPIHHSLHTGTSIHVQDDIFWRKDGTSFPVEYITNPIIENCSFVGTVITFKDISEMKKTEELLHNSEKLKAVGQLAAGIAHEIRNPLTSLKGFLQLTQTVPEQKQEYFKIMKEELNRIEIILSELLLLAKPQAAVFEQKDIRTLLLNVITLLDTQAIMNNVQIMSKFEADDLIIKCDANQIKQVFINLIKNAIESMPGGGEVFINAIRQGSRINVQVLDQGCGIPEDKLGMIGQPFFSTKEKGTGLGLMVSYSIIENHHGKISVNSRLSEGTSFTVTLPAYLE